MHNNETPPANNAKEAETSPPPPPEAKAGEMRDADPCSTPSPLQGEGSAVASEEVSLVPSALAFVEIAVRPQLEAAAELPRLEAAAELPQLEAAPLVAPSEIKTEPGGVKKEDAKPARPQRPARLETFLTALVLIAAGTGVTWALARPMTLLFPPTQEQAAQTGQSPDCRRLRFDVAQLLGERWRQTISACLRGSCENLRESLIARNFPISTWQLLEEESSGQGCEVNTQGPAKSAECTRLLGRVEGVAKTVLLQVEGECREKP